MSKLANNAAKELFLITCVAQVLAEDLELPGNDIADHIDRAAEVFYVALIVLIVLVGLRMQWNKSEKFGKIMTDIGQTSIDFNSGEMHKWKRLMALTSM
ncbi:hypothetical protein LCGC14_2413370 [marine sediment metagenome]|uniref:Uncharacterized protein n=1 Tax=marine sediment metagenome TaxID=412755 RepID=A0A0F9BRV0_9ZZZZ